MKKTILLIAASLMISTNSFAQETNTQQISEENHARFQAISPDKAIILQDGEAKMFCPKCTKKLSISYKTNHVALVDGKIEQYCSMYCLAEAIKDGGKVTGIKVVDNTTLKFIDVISSWYVMGSSKAATMGTTSKYAFGHKDDAEKFAKEFGGKVMTFYAVLDSVKIELEKDKSQILEKKSTELNTLKEVEDVNKTSELTPHN